MSTDRAFHFDVIVAPPDLTVPGTRLVGFSERSGARFSHQLMPRPSLGIAVDCTQGSLTATGGSARASALVGGMTPRSVVSGATFECLEIQLSPLLARALLDVHPAELGRPLVALDDIWGADAERLRNRIIDAASWAERFDLVHAMLTKRLARHSDATHRPDPVAGDAWRRIVRSGGHLPIGTLPGQYGVGRTQFWKRFREEVGLSPKQAARIVRFDRALRLLGAGAGLAEVAAEAGYSDQPHLNREFADLAGLSPGGLSPGGLRNHPSWRSRVTLHRTSGHADPPIGIPRASSLSPAHS